MSMEPRTDAYLATAERNRQLAQALTQPSAASLVHPLPLEWAVVVAFYAAVHYVNAYLWEWRHYEPRNHNDRENAISRAVALRAAATAYRRLRSLAHYARYTPLFQPGRPTSEAAVRTHVEQVAETVRQALSSAH